MSKDNFSFNLLKNSKSARLGKISTHRGIIDTPTFMTVGTQGTIKSAFIEDVVFSDLVAMIVIGSNSSLFFPSKKGVDNIKKLRIKRWLPRNRTNWR